ncbi:MAG: MAPEG family protein [Bdellovibrionaceae bacterium]|nr:MAPEG family protein [Bdellovibrio sp.]
MIKISLIYAAILGFIFVALSIRVIKGRFKSKVSLGDGGHAPLNVAIRTHANFAEYVPLALIMIMGVELMNYSANIVHALGIILVLARLSHVYGLAAKNSLSNFRPVGVILTNLVLVSSAVLILIRSF